MTVNDEPPIDEDFVRKLQQLYWAAKKMENNANTNIWKRAWRRITRKYY